MAGAGLEQRDEADKSFVDEIEELIDPLTIEPLENTNDDTSDSADGEETPDSSEDNISWKLLDNGTLNISGTGDMLDYDSEKNVPWAESAGKITSVVVGDSVTHIGDFAFANCTGLENLTLPDGLLSIGGRAFRGCNNLVGASVKDGTMLTIPDSVTSIGEGAFFSCRALSAVKLPHNGKLKSIESDTFNGCNALKYINIPDGVETIGSQAFSTCSGLKQAYIPKSVKSIAKDAFNDCNNLTISYNGTKSEWENIEGVENLGVEVNYSSSSGSSAKDGVEKKFLYLEGGDGTSLTFEGEGTIRLAENYTPEISDVTGHYVIAEIKTIEGSKVVTKLELPSLTAELTLTLGGNAVSYKNNKFKLPNDKEYKSRSEFGIPYTLKVENTTLNIYQIGIDVNATELRDDSNLDLEIKGWNITAPSGWTGAKGSDESKVIKPGESVELTKNSELMPKLSYDPPGSAGHKVSSNIEIENMDTLETSARFTVRNDASIPDATSANTELNKLDVSNAITLQEDTMRGLGISSETQLTAFKKELLTDLVLRRAPDNTYGSTLSIPEWEYLVKTGNNGNVRLKLTCKAEDGSSVTDARDLKKGKIMFEVTDPGEALPSELAQGGELGAFDFESVDVSAFANKAYEVAKTALANSGVSDDKAAVALADTSTAILRKQNWEPKLINWKLLVNPTKSILVSGPVNVYIEDENGKYCGSVVDGEAEKGDVEFNIFVYGDTKYITDITEKYKVTYTATEAGEIDVENAEYSSGETPLKCVSFSGVSGEQNLEQEILRELLQDYTLTSDEAPIPTTKVDSTEFYTPESTPGTDDNPGDNTDDKPDDNTGDKPSDNPGDNTGDKPDDNPGDNTGDQPSDDNDESKRYIITFHPKGGNMSTTTMVVNRWGQLPSLPTPRRSGYDFDGWYIDDDDWKRVTLDTVFTRDTDVYAQWTDEWYYSPSSSDTTRRVYVRSASNGSVTASPKNAAKGDTVTLRINPDSGYELDSITVTDSEDNRISVRRQNSEKYTFTMPRYSVTVRPEFTRIHSSSSSSSSYYYPDPYANWGSNYTPYTPWSYGSSGNTGNTSASAAPLFKDVRGNDWYYSAVKYVTDKSIMNGVADNVFLPRDPTTRAMIVTTLYRLEGAPSMPKGEVFSDVPGDFYYADAVAWAASNGIVTGHKNGTFKPNENITREQMAAILYRYAKYKRYSVSQSADLSLFTDENLIQPYAREPMQWANAMALITGITDREIAPQGLATRAQTATILRRFCLSVAAYG